MSSIDNDISNLAENKALRKRKKLSKRARTILIILILLAAIAAAYFFIFAKKPVAPQYFAAPATQGTLTQSLKASGKVAASNVFNSGFGSPGQIKEINVTVGQTIEAGAVLAKLDTKTLQYTVDQSNASLRKAKDALTDLYARGGYTTRDVNQLKDSINLATTKLDLDKEALDKAALKSDIAGTVVAINNKIGDSVLAGGSNSSATSEAIAKSVITVIDSSQMEIGLQLAETEVTEVSLNQQANITVEALTGKAFTGKVTFISEVATETSGVNSYAVTVKFDKPDTAIKPGMSADVTIIQESKENVLYVPSSAVKTSGTESYVEVLVNAAAQRKVVKTGITNDTSTEITEGLTTSDQVITFTLTGDAITSGFGGFGSGQALRGTGTTGAPAGAVRGAGTNQTFTTGR